MARALERSPDSWNGCKAGERSTIIQVVRNQKERNMARRKRLLAVFTVGIFAILGSMQVNAGPTPIERQGPAYRDAAHGAARDTARPKWCKKKKNKDKKACQPKGGGGGGGGGGNCDYASYPDFCIPPYPPDLDCADVNGSDFTVRGSDPHGFDGDGDGVGCES